MSHLGSRVSALLDGRLAPEEEERCWNHVHACHACRDLVEQEGWVKTQLAQLSFGPGQPSHDFKSELVGRCSSMQPGAGHGLAAPAVPDVAATARAAASSPSAAAQRAPASSGVLALGVAGAPRIDPRPPATDLSRPTGPATPAVTGDDRAARGPVSPSRTPLAERLVAIREKIAP